MPRKATAQPRYTAEKASERIEWLARSDSSASSVDQWDIKTDRLAEAVLRGLAVGAKVRFWRSQWSHKVGLDVYFGEGKESFIVEDSTEFDELMEFLAQQFARQLGAQE